MAEYLSPGVYVEEYDSSERGIEGVGTSTAGFVGLAEKGPTIGAPSLVTSFADFTRQFGGYLSEFTYGEYRFLASSVEQFFANGGTRCYIARVIPEDAKKALKKVGNLLFEARNEGKWGNQIQISFRTIKKKKIQLLKKIGEKTYQAKSLSGVQEGDIVVAKEEYNQVASIYDNEVIFEKEFASEVIDNQLIPEMVLYLVETEMAARWNDIVETYENVSFYPSSINYINTIIKASELVKVEAEPLAAILNPVELVLGEGITEGDFVLEGGSDGSAAKIKSGDFMGIDNGPGKRTGIESFLENHVVSIMAVPGITIPEVVVSLVNHCERMKNRFAVIDMPVDMVSTKDLIEYRSMIDSTYAAMYHPWIQQYDRSINRLGYIPPSGAVTGVYSRTDVNRGVHKAPANESILCTGLKINYGKGEQDILNVEGVNLIRNIPGSGIRIWGARTASSNAAFKYVNVRRLFIYVEESIRANTNWVVFEPNNITLWNRVSITISSFLESLWRNGMLAGSSPSESYFVEVGNNTMTKEDIANGRLICNIGIAPVKPAEFVIFRMTQYTTEAAQ